MEDGGRGAILAVLSISPSPCTPRTPCTPCTSRGTSRSTSRSIGFAASLVALVGVLPSLGGCGDTSHRYIANKDENVYLKIPADWNDLPFADSDADRLEELTSQVTLVWRAGATPDLRGTPDLVDPDAPLAFVAVYEVDGQLNQQMSASLARLAASPLGFDPVIPNDDAQQALVEVLDYAPLDFDDMSGSRVIFRYRAESTAEWSEIYDVSSAYDSSRFRLYVLQVGCSTTCFESNQDAIKKVADSWLVTQ